MYPVLASSRRLFFFLYFLLFLLFFGNSLAAFATASDDPRFRIHDPSYAYLDCSACIAFAEHLGRRINASLQTNIKGGSTFISEKKSGGEDKKKRQAYLTSELRAVEVLDKVCNDTLIENYVLRLDWDRGLRVYESEKSVLPFAQRYSRKDADALEEVSKTAVLVFCTRVMSEEEEAMLSLVRKVRDLSDLEWGMCGGNGNNSAVPPASLEEPITKVCVGTEESEKAEIQRLRRYEKWEEEISKGRGGPKDEHFVVKQLQRRINDPIRIIMPSREKPAGESEEGEEEKKGLFSGDSTEPFPLDL